jgi:hypothetical protein
MNRAIFTKISASAAFLLLAACSDGGPAQSSGSMPIAGEKAVVTQRTSEVQSPVEITYRIIGTPIVGQPVALDLQFKSSFGATPYRVTYRVNDETALQLPEAQSRVVSIAPSTDDEEVAQQVTVVPLREGRLYLNVAAVIETENGSMRTVTAVPIQVGVDGAREIVENGEVTTDDKGNLIRTLPASED